MRVRGGTNARRFCYSRGARRRHRETASADVGDDRRARAAVAAGRLTCRATICLQRSKCAGRRRAAECQQSDADHQYGGEPSHQESCLPIPRSSVDPGLATKFGDPVPGSQLLSGLLRRRSRNAPVSDSAWHFYISIRAQLRTHRRLMHVLFAIANAIRATRRSCWKGARWLRDTRWNPRGRG
jgi:hypothetical protein